MIAKTTRIIMHISFHELNNKKMVEEHRLILQKLESNPALLVEGIHKLQKSAFHISYIRKWEQIIEAGLLNMKEKLLNLDYEGELLRLSSPFKHLVTQEEKTEIYYRVYESYAF